MVANAADKALSPLREELVELMEANSAVLDVGCGTGDLLFKAAAKIDRGLGVDLDRDMVEYAERECQERQISNLTFENKDVLSLSLRRFDVATSTLCLHEMDVTKACEVLACMAQNSDRVLVADYTDPQSFLAKVSIEFDEMISGHYQRFRRYRQAGCIPEYVRRCGLKIDKAVPSSIDGIAIWDVRA